VNLPTGIPRAYRLDQNQYSVEARFLGNASEIEAKIAAVQNQTKRA
jgi:2,3-bisphosphoglycerate-dependent phosphoglycerate mutase